MVPDGFGGGWLMNLMNADEPAKALLWKINRQLLTIIGARPLGGRDIDDCPDCIIIWNITDDDSNDVFYWPLVDGAMVIC